MGENGLEHTQSQSLLSRRGSEVGTPYTPYGSRLDNAESTLSLFSRRGSEFGSRYIQVDDSGVYLSSLAVTIIVSSVATIGILLFTLIITLSVMLGSCQSKPMIRSQLFNLNKGNSCESFRLNGEINNLQGWILPEECIDYVANYMNGGQYAMDFAKAVNAARDYLKTITAGEDGRDIVVLDIDETVLSHLGYYAKHHYGAEYFNETSWDLWVAEAAAKPLMPMFELYWELRHSNWGVVFITGRPEHQRNLTIQNLLAAGFSDWTSLILRLDYERGMTAETFKSRRRVSLESQGYRIRSAFGDQWSDSIGPASGNRTFKLPNPMYYIY